MSATVLDIPQAADREVVEYFQDPDVRARMLEYCGQAKGAPTCAFVTGLDATTPPIPMWEHATHQPPEEIHSLWNRGADVSRSLWDTDALTFLFDLDYQDTDRVSDPFVHPAEMLVRLEPMYRIVARRLGRWHCHPMAVITGRGYHFTGRIPLAHDAVDQLAELVTEPPPWFPGVEARRPAGVTVPLDARSARAWTGLGLLLEYLAHAVLREAAGVSPLPVVFNGTEVGPGRAGRAAISLDFSHAGDPMDQRHMRVAFSPYQTHRLRPDVFGADAAERPPLVALPRRHHPLSSVILGGRDLPAGLREARRGSAVLPDLAEGIGHLAASYRRSRLAPFHRQFFADLPGASATADSLDGLPRCLTMMLEYPNDLLLRPAHVQHLVRGLLSHGWRAADIAALVRGRYEADHGWGERWTRLDPATRAEFDVRVFAGLLETGDDALIDFNCVSAQEKDLCPRTECPFDLRHDRERLRTRFS